MSIDPIDWCPYKRGKFGWGHTHTQEHMKIKAEIRVIFLQAKEHQSLPAIPRS